MLPYLVKFIWLNCQHHFNNYFCNNYSRHVMYAKGIYLLLYVVHYSHLRAFKPMKNHCH